MTREPIKFEKVWEAKENCYVWWVSGFEAFVPETRLTQDKATRVEKGQKVTAAGTCKIEIEKIL
jgi:ribosomal protein L14E/L6E/L27E